MDPHSVTGELWARGFAIVKAPGLEPEEASRAPWGFAERLLGERPILVERQPIKAVPGGRSFASSSAFTPLHTDSQCFAGTPPVVQVMACVRPAALGGACLLLDTWPLLSTIQRDEPELYRALFTVYRRIPFVFGDFIGPTVSLRGGRLVFTHAPAIPSGDSIAAALKRFIEAARPVEVNLAPSDILVVDNHRMLHGRRAFDGGGREFVRLLVWLSGERAAPPAFHALAAQVAESARQSLQGAPLSSRRHLGLGAPPSPEARRRLSVVLEMLRGTPPGILAARERIPEPLLYRLRDAALAAAERALEDDVDAAAEAALAEAIERIQ